MPNQEYEFTLILSGVRELTRDALDALYEAGCDDALVGTRDGVAYAEFCREAGSFEDAVLSAIRDVEAAGAGAKVEHVEPDELVTMSEIARRLGITREGVRKRVAGMRGPGNFPPPIGSLTRRSPLWRWTDVVRWHQASLPRRADAPSNVGRDPWNGHGLTSPALPPDAVKWAEMRFLKGDRHKHVWQALSATEPRSEKEIQQLCRAGGWHKNVSTHVRFLANCGMARKVAGGYVRASEVPTSDPRARDKVAREAKNATAAPALAPGAPGDSGSCIAAVNAALELRRRLSLDEAVRLLESLVSQEAEPGPKGKRVKQPVETPHRGK